MRYGGGWARTDSQFVLLTQIPRISQDCFVDGKSHGGWENECVGGCQITPSALSAPITKAHTDPTKFNKNNLW